MNMLLKFSIIFMFFQLAMQAHALQFTVPSLGAKVIDADIVAVGTFICKNTNVLFRVEKSICGSLGPGCEMVVVASGKNPLFDLSRMAEMIGEEPRLILGDRIQQGVRLTGDASSVLPCDSSRKAKIGNLEQSVEAIRLLLGYKALFAEDESELASKLLHDVSNPIGRAAVTAFLAQDVRCWKGNERKREEFGCIIAFRFLQIDAIEEASVWNFYMGMPSIPASIQLRYLAKVYFKSAEGRRLARKALMNKLRLHGYRPDTEITMEMIDYYMAKAAEYDKKWCSRMLDSDNSVIKNMASDILSLISHNSQANSCGKGGGNCTGVSRFLSD